jgi:hypothetical protein
MDHKEMIEIAQGISDIISRLDNDLYYFRQGDMRIESLEACFDVEYRNIKELFRGERQ